MKISLGLVTAMPIKHSLNLARRAEEKGYHRIWVGEDIFHREVFTYLSILSMNTGRIGLASGITSPYVRNKHVILNSGKAVSKLSGGRFTFGLGVGGLPELKRLTGKMPNTPLSVIEETVRFLRDKMDAEIYLGVRGPKMLDLAGRIADGVILSGPKGYIEKTVEIVDKAGKRDVKKVLWNAFYLGRNPSLVSGIVSVMLESMPDFALRYTDREKAEEELCICGSKKKIIEEMGVFDEIGIDEFVIGPPYGRDPVKVVREMGR